MNLDVDHALGRSVTVSAGGVALLTYVYSPDTPRLESPKPYLHPIRTLTGELVSAFRPHDHVWHKGIAWSLPHVGEHNFWGGPTYVDGQGYLQLDNNGSAVHREMTGLAVRQGAATLRHRLDWTTQQGAQVIEEDRALHVTVADATTWVMVFDTAMTNVSGGTLAFGSPTTKGRDNAGYGGLFWRGPRSFTGGVLMAPTGAGGDELRGSRAEWFAFQGRHDGTGAHSTVVIVDDRDNPRHPPQWFARTEEFACLNPAPFFSEEFDLPDRATLRLRYAVVVAAGAHDSDGTAALAHHGRRALAPA
ncbi:PmoA family protein [Dactylosporangium aurantiacum]|uniref:PmoA family protein n=1 Tax=Dactylosporangium aurantiacum TaxID=35754 RepID=A0A9Q9IS27_9ACTN|nr:PmoA family protein [Dactylosporangium aurantiacum]MDG6107643.1 PmoA family protein [Dactylosporangium aurantiacum]UWZ58762.1 PmoA family protein [Dactylosporangium aurantiacum]